MRVLFLSVTTGQGHNQTAKAVMDNLKENNVDCAMLDAFEYINPILSESLARGYLISTKLTPTVYGRLYRLAEKLERNNTKLSINKLTSSVLAKKMTSFLKDYDPDIIVCTHIFAAQLLTHMKNKNLRAKIIGIVTDFTIHPFWEETSLDYYITASDLLNRQAEKKGITQDRIKPIGIPIHTKFSQITKKAEARELLGLEDRDTVFVMSGSMGYGNVIKVIKKLDKLDLDFQIISVCGNNKALKKKIDLYRANKKIYNLGYVDNVDILMDASNCIITKPGGLTVSESLAKGLPMILMNPIPGQEERNVEFLLNNGLAVRITKTYPIDEAVYQLLLDPNRTKAMVDRILHTAKPNATRDLCDFIVSMDKD